MCTTVDRGWPGFPMFPRAAESAFRAAISVPPSAECPTGRTVPAEWPSELGSVYAASLRCSRLFRRATIAGRVNTEERMAAVVEPIEDKDAENKKRDKVRPKDKRGGISNQRWY